MIILKDILVVTGGSDGLGKAIVQYSLKKGLYVCNLDWEKTSFVNDAYKEFVGDISDEVFVQKAISEIAELGNIKYLINNAGEPSFKLPSLYEKKDIDKCLKGLYGMILCTSAVLKKKEEDLKIVNIMSSAALRGNKEEAVYCATKWGERGYTESLKVAYKGTSVKVIGVYPGGINTNFYKNSRDYVSEDKQNSFMSSTDVAAVICDNIFNTLNLNVADIIIERN